MILIEHIMKRILIVISCPHLTTISQQGSQSFLLRENLIDEFHFLKLGRNPLLQTFKFLTHRLIKKTVVLFLFVKCLRQRLITHFHLLNTIIFTDEFSL